MIRPKLNATTAKYMIKLKIKLMFQLTDKADIKIRLSLRTRQKLKLKLQLGSKLMLGIRQGPCELRIRPRPAYKAKAQDEAKAEDKAKAKDNAKDKDMKIWQGKVCEHCIAAI